MVDREEAGAEMQIATEGGVLVERRYRIDNNTVLLLDNTAESAELDMTFDSLEQLEALTAQWPLRRLVELWNNLPNVRPVSRFENRRVANRRIWRALTQPSSTTAPGKRRRARRSKTELVLTMLRRPEGATLKALMKATRWQAHSVRGFLSAKVGKNLGLPLESAKRGGERVYTLRPI
jgi:hypothetical protein